MLLDVAAIKSLPHREEWGALRVEVGLRDQLDRGRAVVRGANRVRVRQRPPRTEGELADDDAVDEEVLDPAERAVADRLEDSARRSFSMVNGTRTLPGMPARNRAADPAAFARKRSTTSNDGVRKTRSGSSPRDDSKTVIQPSSSRSKR